jgi:dTDP-glucose 4,6-dehydratase
MRMVITGGAGFIGSHLCDRFLADGWEVVAIDSLLTGQIENLAHLDREPRFTFIEADITTPIMLTGPVDAVLNFASPASPIDYQKLPLETLKVGSHGTWHGLELAMAKGASFLMASTSEVYGDPQVHPQSESYWGHVNPLGLRSVYDEAKRYAESVTRAFGRTHDVPTQIIRIFNTYGPRMRIGDGRVVPAFMERVLKKEPLCVFGDGSQSRSFCYVDDLVEGIARMVESGHGGPMNLGNPDEHTILELAQICIEMFGGEPGEIRFAPLPSDDPKVRQPDISLARQELGWKPSVSLEYGLRRSADYFREALGA